MCISLSSRWRSSSNDSEPIIPLENGSKYRKHHVTIWRNGQKIVQLFKIPYSLPGVKCVTITTQNAKDSADLYTRLFQFRPEPLSIVGIPVPLTNGQRYPIDPENVSCPCEQKSNWKNGRVPTCVQRDLPGRFTTLYLLLARQQSSH